MSTYTYIARGGQILVALPDHDFGHFDAVGLAPYYADKKLDDWERDGKIAFDEYVGRILGGGEWEYNGSSSWDAADPAVGMTVAVYSSAVVDFAGDQLDALVTHPNTVFYGYLHFVDQGTRYSNAVVDLADIAAPRLCSSESDVKVAFDAVYDAAREHNDPLADIVDALIGTAWDYDRSVGELFRRVPEAA
jgi:hypothetical protein